MLTSGLQYVIQWINYKRDLERIELIVSKAKSAAWGPKFGSGQWKEKGEFLSSAYWFLFV